MPSCTTPIFSKIVVTFCATQPAIAAMCQVSGKAIATVPTAMRPSFHSQIANAAGAHHHARVQHGEAQPEQGRQPHLLAMSIGQIVHRRADELVLVSRTGEQLDRRDVGVAVDDAAGERRARIGHAP